jgi:hypothetical protein
VTEPVRLSTPRVRYRLADDPDTVVEIQAINVDILAWEESAARHKWPKPEDGNAFHWLNFLAWHHSTRVARTLPETMTLKEFHRAALEVIAYTDENGDGVDPTNPGPDTG